MNIEDAKVLALLHMDNHGLLDLHWIFSFESCKNTLGRCHYESKKITLSKWYVELNNEEDVEDTTLHEIAHAISWIRYGRKGKGHGLLWKKVCREIGAIPKACSKGKLNQPKNHHKYSEHCCGSTYKRHRLRKNAKYFCPKCDKRLFLTTNDKTLRLVA